MAVFQSKNDQKAVQEHRFRMLSANYVRLRQKIIGVIRRNQDPRPGQEMVEFSGFPDHFASESRSEAGKQLTNGEPVSDVDLGGFQKVAHSQDSKGRAGSQ